MCQKYQSPNNLFAKILWGFFYTQLKFYADNQFKFIIKIISLQIPAV